MYKRARDWKPTISVETCNSIPQISPENWELDNLMRKHNGRGKGRRRRGGGKGNRNGILDMTKETVVGGGGWEYVDLKRKHSDKKWEGGREESNRDGNFDIEVVVGFWEHVDLKGRHPREWRMQRPYMVSGIRVSHQLFERQICLTMASKGTKCWRTQAVCLGSESLRPGF